MPPERLLIVGLSGRALAQSARAAGFAPIVLDAFADLDTREAAETWARIPVDRDWTLRREALLAAARRLAPAPVPLVWGSGFERRLDLLAELARDRPLLGTAPAVAARLKDPLDLAAACARLGVPYPDVRLDRPEDPTGWLVKRRGGAGGSHVRAAADVPALPPGHYLQRRVPGRPVSILLLGDGHRAVPLIASEQWADPARPGSFRFAGVVAPAALPSAVERRLGEAATAVAGAYGLVGLASADFLSTEDGSFHLLEVNPRPGASLEACQGALAVPLVALHVAACRGRLPEALPAPRRVLATRIVYARRDRIVPSGLRWPAWAGDRTPGGRTIRSGEPICTVRAWNADAADARARAEARAVRVPARLRPPPRARIARRAGRPRSAVPASA